MLLNMYFMPPCQIGHMSLNDFKRQVTTCDKTQTGTRMGKSLVAFNLEH
jgi:hypothetical protein